MNRVQNTAFTPLGACAWLERHNGAVFICFLVFVAILGGGSREDIASLPLLRGASGVLIAIAALQIEAKDLKPLLAPVLLLAALLCIALIQLLPLPQSIWQELPNRAGIARVDALIGLTSTRPLTLSPSATQNFIAALSVPIAGLLWFARIKSYRSVLIAIVCIAVGGALVGILQTLADPRSNLYFYEITSRGQAVGLFANRNHHSVFLACAALICGYLASTHSQDQRAFSGWIYWIAAIFLSAAVIANPSRAGMFALGLALALFCMAKVAARQSADRFQAIIPVFIGVTVFAGLVGLFVFAERSPAVARLLERDPMEDLRTSLLPISIDMLRTYLPWGAGLGAFEHAYRMQEPLALLMPAYVNEAHNDWLQFPIEGGLAALLTMAACIVFAFMQLTRLLLALAKSRRMHGEAWLGLGILLILGFASIVDYPLRAPFIMLLAIIAFALFAQPLKPQASPRK